MSDLVRGGKGIVPMAPVTKWEDFCKALADALFQTVVLRAIAAAGGDPKTDIVTMQRDAEYFHANWPEIGPQVTAEYNRLLEEQRVKEQESRRSRGNEILAEHFAQALGVTDHRAVTLLTAWLSQQHAPASLPEQPYRALLDVPLDKLDQYPYADAIEAVLQNHLWWAVPESFDRDRFLRGVRGARFKTPFLFIWSLFGEEIEWERQARGTGPADVDEQAWVERDTKRAAVVFSEEWEQRGRATGHLPAHPEYGLLNAVATEQVMEKFRGRLQEFLPSVHAPQVIRGLLNAEVRKGVTKRSQTRFFSDKARGVVETYNRLVQGDPSVRPSLDPDLLRSVRNLQSHEILLDLEANA